MSEVHALFTVAFPIELGDTSPATPKEMVEFFYNAIENGYEIPLPVFVTSETLVKLDAFIEDQKLDA